MYLAVAAYWRKLDFVISFGFSVNHCNTKQHWMETMNLGIKFSALHK